MPRHCSPRSGLGRLKAQQGGSRGESFEGCLGWPPAKRGIHTALFEVRLFNDDLGAVRRSQARVAGGPVDQVTDPSETPVPDDSAVAAITLAYSEPGLDVLGWRIHWMVLYVIISMITAFAFAKRVGVTL